VVETFIALGAVSGTVKKTQISFCLSHYLGSYKGFRIFVPERVSGKEFKVYRYLIN